MNFGVGVSVAIAVGVTGFPKPTVTESGTMPSGLSFNSAAPAYTGAAAAGSVGRYPISLTAANGIGSPASQDVILTVDQATMTYPTNGQLKVDTTRAFTWSPIPDAYAYVLWIGLQPGAERLIRRPLMPTRLDRSMLSRLPRPLSRLPRPLRRLRRGAGQIDCDSYSMGGSFEVDGEQRSGRVERRTEMVEPFVVPRLRVADVAASQVVSRPNDQLVS